MSFASKFHSSNSHYCQVPARYWKYPGEKVRRGPALREFTGQPWLQQQQQQGEVRSKGLLCQVWGIWDLQDNSMLRDIKGGKSGLTRTNK